MAYKNTESKKQSKYKSDNELSRRSILEESIGSGSNPTQLRQPENQVVDLRKTSLTRRTTLKSVFGGITGLSLTNVIARKGLGSGPVEITTIEHRGKAKETKLVPRDWYQHVQAVRKAFENLQNKWQSKDWFTGIGQTADSETIAGMKKHKLKVYVTDRGSASQIVPSHVDGIPIDIELEKDGEKELDGHVSDQCENYDYRQSCPEGGSYLTNDINPCCFSATCIVEYNSNPYLMTSGHVFNSDCSSIECGDVSGSPLYSGPRSSRYYFGDVSDHSYEYDFVIVPNQGTNVNGISNEIISEGIEHVEGHVTQNGIYTLINDDDAVHHTGISTGRTTGLVEEIVSKDTGFCAPYVDMVKTSTNAAGGDSGGPHFDTYNDGRQLAIIGHHLRHELDSSGDHDYSLAPAAYEVADIYNITFGRSSTC